MLHVLTRPLAAALGAALISFLCTGATLAADGGLVVITDARYQVFPAESRVHVSLSSVATSFEPDTVEGRTYFSGITFVVPAGATDISAASAGRRLAVSVVEDTADYRAVKLDFSRGVFYGESYPYSVTFDLVDSGGEGNRDLRIGQSVVAFPVWAFGTEGVPGGSVRVELPAGYQPTVQGSAMTSSSEPSGPVLTASPQDPYAFFAYVSADRPGAFDETPLQVTLAEQPARITVRAWQDDAAWGRRMTDLLGRGLPALESAIGVPYPNAGRLGVEEAAISRLGEYAGIYDPTEAVIRVRYDADGIVALHEAAHIWFNDRLFDDRWIGEAWAEYYAVTVADQIGESGYTWELSDDLLASRIPLNDWGAVGREDVAVEDFAYAATYDLALQIADRTDRDALQLVWQAAFERQMAYLPPDDAAASEGRATLGQPGWQRLLDLLEERTGAAYADLWAQWVVNAEQQPLLAARASLRSRYRSVIEEAGEWRLPSVIRVDLGAWRFSQARDELARAERVLTDRDRIAAAALELGLQPSDRLRLAFEGSDGLQAGAAAAEVELATLDELAGAARRLAAEPGPLEAIGLVGSDPGTLLDQARDAYQAGDLGTARRGAAGAIAARDDALAAGSSRVTLAGALLLAVDGLALSIISARRLRRRTATLSVP